jgi:Ca2+-binding EF-hand superfamily protein
MDEDEIGGITFDAFIKMMNPDRKVNESVDQIKRVFRKYDRKNRGFITYDDFKTIVVSEILDIIDIDKLKDVF